MQHDGVKLTWAQADGLGDSAIDWLRTRLNLKSSTNDHSIMFRPTSTSVSRRDRRDVAPVQIHAKARVSHARKKTQTDSKASDKINIDQLAALFDLPPWERIDEMNQQHYWEMARGAEDEDAQIEAERQERDEVYRQWYDAVEGTAEKLLGEHGLELLALRHTRKIHQNYRPHTLKIVPSTSWTDAANKIRETINGAGMFHFDNLAEFLASGPYTARQAVLSHLSYVKQHPDVYGGSSARQLYDQHWR